MFDEQETVVREERKGSPHEARAQRRLPLASRPKKGDCAMLGRDGARVQDKPAPLAQRTRQHLGQEEMGDDP